MELNLSCISPSICELIYDKTHKNMILSIERGIVPDQNSFQDIFIVQCTSIKTVKFHKLLIIMDTS